MDDPRSDVLRVLLVEDNQNFAFALQEALGLMGGPERLVVDHVGRLDETLARLAAGDVDVILLDLTLPDGRGMEAIEAIRGLGVGAPIVVLTGHDDRALAVEALQTGAQDFLVKGQVDSAQLLRAIRNAVGRKQDEREIRHLNQQLERHVAELTAMTQELEAFSYSVSHDLRAPLRHISGFAQLLAADAGPVLDESCRHYLDVIVDSSRQMSRLIDDLLAFSRAGRAELHKAPVDLGALVAEVVEQVKEAGREIAWQIGPLGEVYADRGLLTLVLVTLLGNAVKYTRGRPAARVEIGRTGEPPAEAVVQVRDNGVGFDPRYGHKLFGVFQRLHRAEDFEGTGVGLANVRRIIQRHGGRTWAESKPGEGAAFYFSLPPA